MTLYNPLDCNKKAYFKQNYNDHFDFEFLTVI